MEASCTFLEERWVLVEAVAECAARRGADMPHVTLPCDLK